MSHSFYLEPVKDLKYTETLQAVGIPGLLLTDDSPQAVDDNWPIGDVYLYIDNLSVRPLEVSYDGNIFQVRIFQASSIADYELAHKLAVVVARKHNCKIHPEDNDELICDEFEKLYNEQWAKDHIDTMVRMMVGMWQEKPESELTMSGTRTEIKVGARMMESLLKDKENLVKNFLESFRRLNYIDREDVYVSSITVLGEKDDPSKELRTATYGEGVCTLLTDKADLITLVDSGHELMHIQIDHLAEILNQQALWLGDNFLLAPSLSSSDWEKLRSAAKQHNIEDIFTYAKTVEPKEAGSSVQNSPLLIDEGESYQAVMTSKDWQTLVYCPFIVFLLVAGADGKIDKKEIEEFQKLLLMGLVFKNKLLSEVMFSAIQDAPRVLAEVVSGQIQPLEIILQIKIIVDKSLDAESANEFKFGMLHIGKEIAASSGGIFGIFGSKISAEEKQCLAGLAALLDVKLPSE